MRILLTADPELPVPPVGYGGIERIVAQLAAELRERGHTVGLLAHRDSSAEVDWKGAWPAASSRGPQNTVRNARTMWWATRSFRPDVVHSFSRLAYLLPLFILRPRLRKVMSYQRHTGGRSVRWAAKLGGRALTFTGCSEFICRMGRPAGGSWTSVPNFVDTRSIPFSASVPADAPLLFLSRLEAIKGAHLAIQIARRSNRRLLLAGNRPPGREHEEYFARHIAPELGEEIEWVGEVDDRRKLQLLARTCALIVPIQWDEPFGIVFAEALAAGVPVLTCARGATPEIVASGKTGFFISDVNDGAEAVGAIGGLDRSACREAAERDFDVRVAARRYVAHYQSHAEHLSAPRSA